MFNLRRILLDSRLGPSLRAVKRAIQKIREFGLQRRLRRITGRFDDRRFPIAPLAVVVDPQHTPDVAASTGRSALFASRIRRFATTSGIEWSRPDVFVVVYLITSAIGTYRVTPGETGLSFESLSTLGNVFGLGDFVNVTSSRNGQFLAVSSSAGGGVGLFGLSEDGVPQGEVVATVGVIGDRNVHGIAFSSDSRHLVYTSIDDPGGVRVVRVGADGSGRVTLDLVEVEANEYSPQKPKGVAFTNCGRFVVLAYGANATSRSRKIGDGFVITRQWNQQEGRLGPVVSRSSSSLCIPCAEDVALIDNDCAMVLIDHFQDSVYAVSIDPDSGTILNGGKVISWKAGGLNSPHGCGVSPDGKTLAVTNYGDASIGFFDSSQIVTFLGSYRR